MPAVVGGFGFGCQQGWLVLLSYTMYPCFHDVKERNQSYVRYSRGAISLISLTTKTIFT